MANTGTTTSCAVSVKISPDKMQAMLSLQTGNGDSPTPDGVAAALEYAGVFLNDAVRARIDQFVKLAAGGKLPAEPFVVAQARPAAQLANESVEWDPALAPKVLKWGDPKEPSYAPFSATVPVSAGTVVGKVVLSGSAEAGVDVLGNALPLPTETGRIEVGGSLKREEKTPFTVTATAAGLLVLAGMNLEVDEAFNVEGDVTASSKKIASPFDVNIEGVVENRAVIRGGKSVVVGGMVEAADLRAAEHVFVRGGIVGRGAGMVNAGGDVIAKFCQEAELHAGGDVKVSKGLVNCTVFADGELLAERGSLVGGHVCVGGDITVESLGNDANAATRIVMGITPSVLLEIIRIEEDVERKVAAIAEMRKLLQPFAEAGPQTSERHNQARDYLKTADEAEVRIKAARKRLEKLVAQLKTAETPAIHAAERIHAGVTIVFGSRVVKVNKPLKGPVLVDRRKIDNVTEIAAVNPKTGMAQALVSRRVPEEEFLAAIRPGARTEV